MRVRRREVAEGRRSLIFLAAFAGALLLAAASAYLAWRSWRQTPEPYDIILLTTESTRLDAIGPETTPNLWRLAGRGSRFTQHRGSSAWTSAGAVSILTGLSAFEHGIHTRDESVPEYWPLPLKDLAARGWKVGGLQSFMQIPNYAHLGMSVEAGVEPEAWIAARLKAKEPYFLWYHYLPTHLPYNPAPAFRPDWQALLPPGDAGAVARLQKVMTQPVIPAGSVHFRGFRPTCNPRALSRRLPAVRCLVRRVVVLSGGPRPAGPDHHRADHRSRRRTPRARPGGACLDHAKRPSARGTGAAAADRLGTPRAGLRGPGGAGANHAY